MPEDTVLNNLIGELKPALDAGVEEANKLYEQNLQKEILILRRKLHGDLLVEFIKFLNARYYSISNDEVMARQIQLFLDEREKK